MTLEQYLKSKNKTLADVASESLDLEGTQITSLPDGLTVGGSLDLQGTQITNRDNYKKPDNTKPISWFNGKYILADDRFSVVISHKKNVWKCHDLNKTDVYYLVTDGKGHFAHGDTVKDAKESLIYKMSDRDVSDYKGLSDSHKFTFAEAVECYRSITGACAEGTRNFVKQKLIEVPESLTIAEIKKITVGEYGHESFIQFFTKET